MLQFTGELPISDASQVRRAPDWVAGWNWLGMVGIDMAKVTGSMLAPNVAAGDKGLEVAREAAMNIATEQPPFPGSPEEFAERVVAYIVTQSNGSTNHGGFTR